MARRTKKEDPTFTFTYEGNRYNIKLPYNCQPATLVLTDGKVLHVRVWNLMPLEPQPYQVETFDPETQPAAELAHTTGGFLAEVVEK